MKTKENNTAVIYARVSSSNDRQSTERQVFDLTKYADCNSLKLLKVYEEHISGAKKNSERPVLTECLQFCFENSVSILMLSELSRLGRNVDEVLANVRLCKERHLNIYFQKENISIFQADGSENPYLTIMIAVLGTCAQMERENIYYRLNSGRRLYIEKGGRLGRRKGSVKTHEQKEEQYKDVLAYLRKSYKIADVAKLTGTSTSTVQRLKSEFQIR